MAELVPEWRSGAGSEVGPGSRLGLLLWIPALFFLAYQAWLLPVLTDWVGSAVDEGFTSYAAQRIREGAWPHRDFFYLWTPGTPLLHALLQTAGLSWIGERAAPLLAFLGSVSLVLERARDWRLPVPVRIPLAALLAVWSFSLWNIPYSSWYAVFFALAAMRALSPGRIERAGIAGLLFALTFWFKQNVGILACVGALGWLLWRGDRRSALRLAALFLGGLAVPFAAIGIFGGATALGKSLWQIFLFPLRYPGLMGQGIGAEVIAAPLSALGLWILSLFFLRRGAASGSSRMIQLGVLAYGFLYASRAPADFFWGSFALLSIAAWPLSLALAITETDRAGLARFLAFWLPGLGVFLQIYPRLDFQHFLFVFPLVALLLVHAAWRLTARYPQVPRFWTLLPLLLLLGAGAERQWAVVQLRLEGQEDSLGRISSGGGQRLDEEVTAVRRYLRGEGLRDGDPILVLPNATSVYRWTGFRDPTPHLQFFPGYVEAFGGDQSTVLKHYRSAGGRFLVVQERSGLETDVPEIWREIQKDYQVVKSFPEHFTVYVPN